MKLIYVKWAVVVSVYVYWFTYIILFKCDLLLLKLKVDNWPAISGGNPDEYDESEHELL